MTNETKNERFKRLAKQRGERILRDLQLLANLSNKNNYEYSEEEVRKLFLPIEEDLRRAKLRFGSKSKREINF